MKILYAGTIDLQSDKGDTIHFVSLAQELAALGHRLTMVAFNEPAAALGAEVEVVALHRLRMPKIGTFLTDGRFMAALVRLSLRQRFDILYQRGIPMANQWARGRGLPAISEVNGIQVDELRATGMSEAGLQVYRRREQLIVRDADRVICVTEGIRHQLTTRYGVQDERCVVIPNATNTRRFAPASQLACRQKVGLSPERYHVGFVGDFQPWIDFDTLLAAVALLEEQGVPVCCTLVGDGFQYQQVAQKVQSQQLEKSVQLVGWQPHASIPDWINAFDVCVAPFMAERNQAIGLSPLKLYEYMACERPVVATQMAGITETLQAVQSNFLYPIGNSRQLANHLATLYAEPETRMAVGKRSRAYVLQNHSWAYVAQRTEAIMAELLQKNNSGMPNVLRT